MRVWNIFGQKILFLVIIFIWKGFCFCQTERIAVSLNKSNFQGAHRSYTYFRNSNIHPGKWQIVWPKDADFQVFIFSDIMVSLKIPFTSYKIGETIIPEATIVSQGNLTPVTTGEINISYDGKDGELNNGGIIFKQTGNKKIKISLKKPDIFLQREFERTVNISTGGVKFNISDEDTIESFHFRLPEIIKKAKKGEEIKEEKEEGDVNIALVLDVSGSMSESFANSNTPKLTVCLNTASFILNEIRRINSNLRKNINLILFKYDCNNAMRVSEWVSMDKMIEMIKKMIQNTNELEVLETANGRDVFSMIHNSFVGMEKKRNYVIFVSDAQDEEFFSTFYSEYSKSENRPDRLYGDTEARITDILNIKYFPISVEQDENYFNGMAGGKGQAYVHRGDQAEFEQYLSRIIMEMVGMSSVVSGKLQPNQRQEFMIDRSAKIIEIIVRER